MITTLGVLGLVLLMVLFGISHAFDHYLRERLAARRASVRRLHRG